MRKIKEKDAIRKEKRRNTSYRFLLVGSIKGAVMAALIAGLFFESLWGLLCLPVCITFFLLMERISLHLVQTFAREQYCVAINLLCCELCI
mgnify:CR=1 FL=1